MIKPTSFYLLPRRRADQILLDPPPAVKEPPDQLDISKVSLNASNADVAQPLAPPPRPAPHQQNPTDADYFSGPHANSHFSLEPNPFEQSFGNPSSETPGSKSLLPPVASLTSPSQPLLGGTASGGGYNWTNSLRSGPLSPAMLGGPVGPADYFDPAIRGSFPTPNESSLRTGLTPGGGGSMFPAPSPNSQALYQQLASAAATPGTLDFQSTAMAAAAARKDIHKPAGNATSQPQDKRAPVAPMDHSSQQQQSSAFGPHDNDAANGLYLLAQAGGGAQSNNQFAVPNPPKASTVNPDHSRPQNTSPQMMKRVGTAGSIGGSLSGSARAVSEISEITDSGDQGKPPARVKGKRGPADKATVQSTGRRKADEAPAKQPSSKKTKIDQSQVDINMNLSGIDSEEETNIKEEQYHENGKKMTDEEKRKNFLERNRFVTFHNSNNLRFHFMLILFLIRVAALKCRQRKKQWLANLQAKVELFSNENDNLSAQVAQLREEIVNMKQILLQHKDCSVSQGQGQGLGPYFPQPPEFASHTNPYGIMGQNGQTLMAGQRR